MRKFDQHKTRILIIASHDFGQQLQGLLKQQNFSCEAEIIELSEVILLLNTMTELSTIDRRPDLILFEVPADDLPEEGQQNLSTLLLAAKKNQTVPSIPVLTISHAEDVTAEETYYDHGVNAHLYLPLEPKALAEKLKVTADFWLGLSRLPGY